MKYQDISEDGKNPTWWTWKNFTPKEVSCKHCGEIWQGDSSIPPDWFIESMDTLQLLRDQLGKPLVINSAHRCKTHNKSVGGVANSQHYTHIAFDCRCPKGIDVWKLEWIAQNAGFKFTLKYPDKGFVHCDMRIGK